MKALLINTPLNIKRDLATESTLIDIQQQLVLHGWNAQYFVAETLLSYREKVIDFKPDVTLCYDYIAGDGLRLRQVNEELDIPDIFANQDLLDLFYNKEETKKLAIAYGLIAPKSIVISQDQPTKNIPFDPPYFIKPLHGGDSRGIHNDNVFVTRQRAIEFVEANLKYANDSLMVEQYIHDDESFEFGVFMSYHPGQLHYAALKYNYSIPANQRFKYMSKEIKDDVGSYDIHLEPFDLPSHEIVDGLIGMFDQYKTHGIVKAEFISAKSGVYLIEINGIPGLNLCFRSTSEKNGLKIGDYMDLIFKSSSAKK